MKTFFPSKLSKLRLPDGVRQVGWSAKETIGGVGRGWVPGGWWAGLGSWRVVGQGWVGETGVGSWRVVGQRWVGWTGVGSWRVVGSESGVGGGIVDAGTGVVGSSWVGEGGSVGTTMCG